MNNLHFDMNPWAYVEDETSSSKIDLLRYSILQNFIVENNEVGVMKENILHLQGLVNLADNKDEDGGFHLVPGFKNHIVPWVQSTQDLSKDYDRKQKFIVLPQEDPLYKRGIRITARAGSCIIWDQRSLLIISYNSLELYMEVDQMTARTLDMLNFSRCFQLNLCQKKELLQELIV